MLMSARDAILAVLDDVVVSEPIRTLHVAIGTDPPSNCYMPGCPHIEIVREGALPLTMLTPNGEESVLLDLQTAHYCLPDSWTQRSLATSRRLFCMNVMEEYVRFTLSYRTPEDPPGMGPQQWYHTVGPLHAGGQLAVAALNTCARQHPDPVVLLSLLKSLLTIGLDFLKQDRPVASGRRRHTWEVLRDYVRTHAHLPINRNSVAHDFGLDPDYVSRLFSDEGTERFQDYLTRLRMERARMLLQEGNLTVKELARSCGYSEAGYFIKVFRKFHGVTPTRFRP